MAEDTFSVGEMRIALTALLIWLGKQRPRTLEAYTHREADLVDRFLKETT